MIDFEVSLIGDFKFSSNVDCCFSTSNKSFCLIWVDCSNFEFVWKSSDVEYFDGEYFDLFSGESFDLVEYFDGESDY